MLYNASELFPGANWATPMFQEIAWAMGAMYAAGPTGGAPVSLLT